MLLYHVSCIMNHDTLLLQSSSVMMNPAHSVLEVEAEDEGEDGEDGEVSDHRTGWIVPVVHPTV